MLEECADVDVLARKLYTKRVVSLSLCIRPSSQPTSTKPLFSSTSFNQPLQHLVIMPESELPSNSYPKSDTPSIQELGSHIVPVGARVRITN
jgi:hypothetical protein